MSEHTDNLINVPLASKSLTNHIHIEWMNSFVSVSQKWPAAPPMMHAYNTHMNPHYKISPISEKKYGAVMKLCGVFKNIFPAAKEPASIYFT